MEGAGTERDYLQGLNDEYGAELGFHIDVTVNTQHGLSPGEALDKAKGRVDKLRSEAGNRRTAIPAVWILIDRDENSPETLQAVADKASSYGINLALSDPCFELWLLLHFADNPGPQGGERKSVYSRLQNSHEAYSDYGTGSGNKRLPPPRLEPLMSPENIQAATMRAYRLTRDCESGDCHHVESGPCRIGHQDPSSGVYKLLTSLRIGNEPAKQ